jgi:hypothetical protein
LKTSPQMSCLLKHPRMRPTPAGTPDVSATEGRMNDAGVSETAYPSTTLQRPSNKSKAGYTPPPSNASCRSQRKTLTSCESTTRSTSLLLPGTATTKLQVATQTSAVIVLEPSCRLSPTVLVQTPADHHKAATAIVRSSLTATLAAAAATWKLQPWGQQEGRRRGRSRRLRPRKQPRLRSLTGRL